MKAIDKNLFKKFLPPDEQGFANSAGAAPDESNGRREISSRDVGRKVRILSRGPLSCQRG
jgi:hypothetical protein